MSMSIWHIYVHYNWLFQVIGEIYPNPPIHTNPNQQPRPRESHVNEVFLFNCLQDFIEILCTRVISLTIFYLHTKKRTFFQKKDCVFVATLCARVPVFSCCFVQGRLHCVALPQTCLDCLELSCLGAIDKHAQERCAKPAQESTVILSMYHLKPKETGPAEEQ